MALRCDTRLHGMGHNEILIGRALKYRRSKALVKLSATDLADRNGNSRAGSRRDTL